MHTIQENIYKLRKEAAMTQRQLANALGVSYQTVSKWENALTMPDISLLGDLAKVFKITTDQLLGIRPLGFESYTKRLKNSDEYRDTILDQYQASHDLYWNQDYLAFMVHKVWKLNKPIKVAELSCGNGMFAKQLLAHLPKGSTYTGYENSPLMRARALEAFESEDHLACLTFDDISYNTYDLVVCQGYLRHLKAPLEGIQLMKKMARDKAIILCHEENRPFENVGLLLGDEKDHSFEKATYLEKMWAKEKHEEGRDYRIGLRLPLLFQACGLKDIQCRMNDHVNLALGDDQAKACLDKLNLHYKITSIDEKDFMTFLLERGLSRSQAFRYIDLYNSRKAYMHQDPKAVRLVHVMGLMLTWARL